VHDSRWSVGARSDCITSDVLFRGVTKHLVCILTTASQRGRLLLLFPILIRISRKARLLSTRFRRNAGLVLVLSCCHTNPLCSFSLTILPAPISIGTVLSTS